MSNNYETYEVRVYPNGSKFWLQKGKLHRLNGPAIEKADGTNEWYQWDKPHRLDGPAIEYPDGTKGRWYIEGKEYTEQAFNQKVKELTNPTCNGKVVEIEGKKYRLQLVDE